MSITSTQIARLNEDRSDTGHPGACETCHSPVDLTTSVLVKGDRIVGCPGCNWGGSRVRARRSVVLSAPSAHGLLAAAG